MADLDALLGIQPEPEQQPEQPQKREEETKISISPGVLAALAEAEAKRAENLGATQSSEELQARVKDSIERIVEQAKKLSKEGSAPPETAGEQAIRDELQQLYSTMVGGAQGVDAEDLRRIKEQAFGPSSFWVTDTRVMPDLGGGVLVRGNLRRLGQESAVFEEVCAKVAQLCGDKYVVQLLPDPDEEAALGTGDAAPAQPGRDGATPTRVAFAIVPAAFALPLPATSWQRLGAGVLLVLALGSTLQFGLSASIGLLPAETLAWLADPANLTAGGGAGDVLPPGLEAYDPLPFFSATGTVFLVTLLPQLAHELAHVAAAALRGLRIGPSLLVPYTQLGLFGSVTQLKSMARNRSVLFDFAAAGLLAGGVASLGLFLVGLAASHGGAAPDAGLIPVPAQLFQGSLLLGGLARLGLDPAALAHPTVYVSPLLVGGWCGLVATALNALPVGNLDGGRAMLAAYGRNALAVSSVLGYVGLGLGLLGSSLSLPFGLFVLVCQRDAERYIQDEVSGAGKTRRVLAAALVAFAVLTLVPGGPDIAGDGMSVNFFQSMPPAGGPPPML